jgi:hypothetical protein
VFAMTRHSVSPVMFLTSGEMLSFKSCNVGGLFAYTLSFSKPQRKRFGLVTSGDFGGSQPFRDDAVGEEALSQFHGHVGCVACC